MDTNEVLRINAALHNLIELQDVVKNAQTVIAFIIDYEIPYSSEFVPSIYSRTTTKSEEIVGDTGIGNTTFQTGAEVKEKGWTHGLYKERVGHFKIWHHLFEYGQCTICFQHHWASEFNTAGLNPSPIYCIFYTEKTGYYLYFGVLEKKISFKFWIFTITDQLVRVLHTTINNEGSLVDIGTEYSLFIEK